MVTPFKSVSSGVKDTYTFYQYQLRINIECAFGVLVIRWGIMGSLMLLDTSLQKSVSLVGTLCCLHNWLIDKKDVNDLPLHSVKDMLLIISRGGEILNNKKTPLENNLAVVNITMIVQ